MIKKPKSGDVIETFLNRYKILNTCSKEKFYLLNKIDIKHKLQKDRDYFLPILVKKENIARTAHLFLKIDAPVKDKIINYNHHLKKHHIKTDNNIWIPYYLLCNSDCKQIFFFKKSNHTTTINAEIKLLGKNQKIDTLNNTLKGCAFYIVSGHGGPDPGTNIYINNKMLCEDEYAYDVSLRLSKELMRRGAKTYMIVRDTNDGIRDEDILNYDNDELCYPSKTIPLNQVKRLQQRVNSINALYARDKKNIAT